MRKLILLAAVFLTACEQPATPVSVNGARGNFQVERLFTVDGCTAYRFSDGGRARYFTDCRGTSLHAESCGKNCTQDVEIPSSGR